LERSTRKGISRGKRHKEGRKGVGRKVGRRRKEGGKGVREGGRELNPSRVGGASSATAAGSRGEARVNWKGVSVRGVVGVHGIRKGGKRGVREGGRR